MISVFKNFFKPSSKISEIKKNKIITLVELLVKNDVPLDVQDFILSRVEILSEKKLDAILANFKSLEDKRIQCKAASDELNEFCQEYSDKIDIELHQEIEKIEQEVFNNLVEKLDNDNDTQVENS